MRKCRKVSRQEFKFFLSSRNLVRSHRFNVFSPSLNLHKRWKFTLLLKWDLNLLYAFGDLSAIIFNYAAQMSIGVVADSNSMRVQFNSLFKLAALPIRLTWLEFHVTTRKRLFLVSVENIANGSFPNKLRYSCKPGQHLNLLVGFIQSLVCSSPLIRSRRLSCALLIKLSFNPLEIFKIIHDVSLNACSCLTANSRWLSSDLRRPEPWLIIVKSHSQKLQWTFSTQKG